MWARFPHALGRRCVRAAQALAQGHLPTEWASSWPAHVLGAPQWGGPRSEVACPRPRVQTRRLLALVNLTLAPETPLAFSLRRLGRAALGAGAGATFGLPLPHTHTSDPSPLAREALLGGIPRLSRVARAALRTPIRGRPWGNTDTPPTSPRPSWAPTPPTARAEGRYFEPLQADGGEHQG